MAASRRAETGPGASSAQSVGGGGGASGGGVAKANGGDLSLAVTLGGNGGSGANGGAVTVTNNVDLLTRGSDADAIFAQSVGGGGGIAGKGSSSAGGAQDPEDAFSQLSSTISKGLGLGQDVTQIADGVFKVGDGALKDINKLSDLETILPGGEDSLTAAGDDEGDGSATSLKLSATIGGQGGAGGTGSMVTVNNNGNLATTGTSSDGIYAQSIGGGGGVGGASSFSGSIGPASGKLQIGASGAGGGDGGQVEATNAATGSISTEGVTSNGITAESVGGGGGKGGITGGSMGALKDISVTLGGSGGQGGDGATVTVNDYGAITTSGRHSYGILAQSTGGGGGIAHVLSKDRSTDDSDPGDISVAIGIGGNGGAGGTGGPVTVNVGQSAVSEVSTTGTGGIGIVAQSVGGGGGLVVATSKDTDDSNTNGLSSSTVIPVTIGGSSGSSGDGGPVSVTLDPTSSHQTTGLVRTSGADAYGVLAQSVGGGGGLVVGASNPQNALSKLFPAGNQSGNGGFVNVMVNNGFSIGTAGAGAVGIFAQSVGGGGGVIGGMSDVDLTQGMQATPQSESGQSGDVLVQVESGSNIVTSGAGAHAIFAQSVGGGGGVISSPDGKGYAFSGTSPYTDCSGSACTGSVTVELGSNTVTRASGPDSYAIFVQSRGNGLNSTTVNVGSGAFVESWAKSAGAIYVGGDASTGRNLIIVQSGGTIDDGTGSNLPGGPTPNATGVAITGSAPFLVLNSGTINGSYVSPKGLASSIDNRRRGQLNTGAIVDLGPGGLLKNSGTVDLGGSGQIATTTLQGDFIQTKKGQLRIDADHANAVADQLIVSGDIELAGKIRINPLTLGSTSLTVLQAGGTLTLDPNAKLVGTRLVHYTPTLTGQKLQVTPTVNFRGMDRDLDRAQRSVAAALQQMWEGSGAEPLARAASPAETDSGTGSDTSAESAFSQGLAAIAESPELELVPEDAE